MSVKGFSDAPNSATQTDFMNAKQGLRKSKSNLPINYYWVILILIQFETSLIRLNIL